MTGVTELPESGATTQAAPGDGTGFVGVVTRSLSWAMDALLINLVAIMTGLGAELLLSIFPLAKSAQPALKAIAGAAYVIWTAAYFVAFWSITGQTPGARVMQIRLVAGKRPRVKPTRAVVRWVGMNLAMLPLFAGYWPILFGRRGFPDWLARTLVIEAPQVSLAEARRAAMRASRNGPGGSPPGILTDPEPSSRVAAGGAIETDGTATRASTPI